MERITTDVRVANEHVSSAKHSEAVLMTIDTSDGVKISVYVDLTDMDVTLSTVNNDKASVTKIVPLPQP